MPAQQEDYDKIKALQEQAKSATARYGSLSSSAETFPGNVMDMVRASRAERGTSQLATDVGNTMGYLGTAGPEARARLADVNPLQTDVITARERGANLAQLGTEAQFGQEMQGTLAEAIEGGASTVRAMAQKSLVEAEQKKQEASDLLEMLMFKEQQEKQAFDEWATKEGLRLEEARINKTTGGGGLSASDMAEMDAMKNAAYGSILAGIRDGTIKNDEDIRISLYSAGLNPNDPAFADLYGKTGGTQQAGGWTVGDIYQKAKTTPFPNFWRDTGVGQNISGWFGNLFNKNKSGGAG